MRSTKVYRLFLLAWFLAGAALFYWPTSNPVAPKQDSTIAEAGRELGKLQVDVNSLLDALWPSVSTQIYSGWNTPDAITADALPPETDVLVYDGDTIVSWVRALALPDLRNLYNRNQLIQLGNGIYLTGFRKEGKRSLLVMTRIWTAYAVQNEYLQNGFHPALGLEGFVPVAEKESKGFRIKNQQGDLSLRVLEAPSPESTSTTPRSVLTGCWLLLGFALALRSIQFGSKPESLVSGLLVVTGRLGLEFSRKPDALFGSPLFDPSRYASGIFLGSMGDLLLSALSLYCLGMLLNRFLKRWSEPVSSGNRRLVLPVASLLTVIAALTGNHVLHGLVVDSRITFDLTEIASADIYTVFGLLSMILLMGVLNVMAARTAHAYRMVSANGKKWRQSLLQTFLPVCAIVAYSVLIGNADLSTLTVLLTACILVLIRIPQSESTSNWLLVASVFFCSMYASDSIFRWDEKRQEERMQQQARRLGNQQDMVAEFLLRDVLHRMANDTFLIGAFKKTEVLMRAEGSALQEFTARLSRDYFGSYLRRYDVQLKFFDRNGLPVNRAGDPGWDLTRIQRESGLPTGIQGLHYLHDDAGRLKYTALITLEGSTGTVAAELTAREETGKRGLPVLLMEKGLETESGQEGLSSARYLEGRLISRQGDFNYFVTASPYRNYFAAAKSSGFVHFQDHIHLFSKQGNALVLVSKPERGILHRLTLFSYILTFSGTVLALVFTCLGLVRNTEKIRQGLRSEIQGGIILAVSLTLVLIGATTVFYLIGNYRSNQLQRLEAIAEDIRLLSEEEVRSLDSPMQASDKLQYTFEKLSSDLQTDFNVFNTEGALFFSSQPGVYRQGISTPLMNREAYKALTRQQRSTFNQTEWIGTLKFLSAYELLRNQGGKVIGFIQFPYFDRETELKGEISRFLVALINLYVLLFCVAVGFGFIIAGRITAPLALLESKLGKTRLDSGLERIDWKHRDEFGRLVEAYNRMLEELEQSAGQLARSERESAWREMARQVAHEIKNPLTPMKLGVQHLERVMLEGGTDAEEKAKRISRTLVEQIDTLAGIATAFGDFARMPGTALKAINAIPIIEDTVALYSNGTETHIEFDHEANELMVLGDKDQLTRILGNLVKNAVQAIPEDRQGRIRILVERGDQVVVLSVLDNGSGIPESQRKNLFVPEFTTKTSGTGLGLAMVKAMAEGMGGSVGYEPLAQEGSRFWVKLRTA
ncbi:MAG: ATP-binding protein [Sphingobacteriales bacterium]|nr:ATP-binding protein [Sphingobacteriales bacterium]